jgi:hypothetical protein
MPVTTTSPQVLFATDSVTVPGNVDSIQVQATFSSPVGQAQAALQGFNLTYADSRGDHHVKAMNISVGGVALDPSGTQVTATLMCQVNDANNHFMTGTASVLFIGSALGE